MKHSNAFKTTASALAVVGVLLAAPAHARTALDGKSQVKVEGLEKIERIDLQGMALISYRATGRSALSSREVVQQADDLAKVTGSELQFRPSEHQGEVYTFVDSKDLSGRLDINARTGDVSFSGGFAQYRGEESTPGLPGRDVAPELALAGVAGIGLLPDESELVVTHIGGLNMSHRGEDGTTADYEKLVSVHFGRELNGLPVHGASRLVVHLAEHGRLQGLIRSWVDVRGERVDPGVVLDRDAVLESAMKVFDETSADATSIRVESAEIVLYDDGQGLIEPAIRVTATRRYADEKLGEQPLDFYIPAMIEARGVFPAFKSRELPDDETERR